jgi:N-acetyl-gamma-glutamyl-phosphate reductase
VSEDTEISQAFQKQPQLIYIVGEKSCCIIIHSLVYLYSMKKSISIIGASGYSGAELLSILIHHPYVTVAKVFANASAGKHVDELYPKFRESSVRHLQGVGHLVFEEYSIDKVLNDDLIFIALPSGEAMNYIPALIDAGKRVVDLGGDFRLHDTALYQKYYKHEHTAAHYLPKAVYGLPEWNKQRIISAQLIANPGCYVTSALLPLLPVVKENLVETAGITISSMSGVSGAGRKSSIDFSFTEINESVKAYKVGTHQHTPEIESVLRDFGGNDATVTFAPHLIPITRGIYTSIYVTPRKGIRNSDVEAAYKKYYHAAPFVRLLGDAEPEIKNVQYSNYIDIGWKLYERNNQLIILSVIDNLVKGAAGQAVQNMNLMFGFEETASLL